MALLSNGYLREIGDNFTKYLKFIDSYIIIGNLSEEEYKKYRKIVKNAARDFKDGKMRDNFDKDAVRAAIMNGDIPEIYVGDIEDD